jgi:glutamate racemase
VVSEKIAAKTGGSQKPEKAAPSSPIGVFDSGVGGLTVLRQIMETLPHEDVIYLADTARVPYGGRTPEEIIAINQEIIPFLIKEGAKLIVMACGTSSAIAYPVLQDEYLIHIISLIEAGARGAENATRSGRIGLIATAATVNSGAYPDAIKGKVFPAACPLFVPLIEGGFVESDETRKVAKEYLKPLLAENIDTLILGCTHYPHLAKIIKEIVGSNVTLVDPAEEVVQDIKKMLKKAGTLKTTSAPGKYEYFVTGSPLQFVEIGSRLFGKPIPHAKQIEL